MEKTLTWTPWNDDKEYNLYSGIDAVYGGWLLETEGEPLTLNDLEDANDDEGLELIAKINEIIADPNTSWEPLTEEDEEYVSGILEAWRLV